MHYSRGMAPELRFDRAARYGAAIVGMLFATFLAIATDFSAVVQSAVYAGTIRNNTPPILAPVLVAVNITSGGYALVMEGLVITLGLGAVWLAAGLDRWLGRWLARRHGRRHGGDRIPDAATRRPDA